MRIVQVAAALFLMVVLTPPFGVAGCAWAMAISELVRLLPSAAYVTRSIRALELTFVSASDLHMTAFTIGRRIRVSLRGATR